LCLGFRVVGLATPGTLRGVLGSCRLAPTLGLSGLEFLGFLGRGGFCFHHLSSAAEPKRKGQWVESREESSVPSGSSKATTRDETWPEEYEQGGLTQLRG
jgi:hypothetical protein